MPPIRLEDLIKKLPSDTEDKVRNAKDRFDQRIRAALRHETRLNLTRQNDDRDGARETTRVPVQVVAGLPEDLQPVDAQSIEEQYRLALLLAPYRPGLLMLRDGAQVVNTGLVPVLLQNETGHALLRERHDALPPVKALADELLHKLREFELTKFVLRVNSDVLGVYRYRQQCASSEPECRIELYWGVIGLVARDLSMGIEDLTCVVLAHELAHAYTHLGMDIDGSRWPTEYFRGSTHCLKEGLAQFYTQVICKRLESFSPGPLHAYGKLLPEQPAAYLVQERWEGYSPEHVRSAMLEIRRCGHPVPVAQFERSLHQERRRLKAARAGA